jgi:hypothetical protein
MKIERNFENDEYVKEITGKEFKDSGALWFVNSILHLFGMAITWNPETDELKASIVRFRGFSLDANDKGYKNLSNYLKDNINELEKDCD